MLGDRGLGLPTSVKLCPMHTEQGVLTIQFFEHGAVILNSHAHKKKIDFDFRLVPSFPYENEHLVLPLRLSSGIPKEKLDTLLSSPLRCIIWHPESPNRKFFVFEKGCAYLFSPNVGGSRSSYLLFSSEQLEFCSELIKPATSQNNLFTFFGENLLGDQWQYAIIAPHFAKHLMPFIKVQSFVENKSLLDFSFPFLESIGTYAGANPDNVGTGIIQYGIFKNLNLQHCINRGLPIIHAYDFHKDIPFCHSCCLRSMPNIKGYADWFFPEVHLRQSLISGVKKFAPKNFVSIHIRNYMFFHHNTGRFFLNSFRTPEEVKIIGEKIVDATLRGIMKLYPDHHILFCSDFQTRLKNSRIIDVNDLPLNTAQKLWLMSQSDLFIGSPSGFSEIISSIRGKNKMSILSFAAPPFLDTIWSAYYNHMKDEVIELTDLLLSYRDMEAKDAPKLAEDVCSFLRGIK